MLRSAGRQVDRADAHGRGSGIVVTLRPGTDDAAVHSQLQTAGVRCSLRAGGIRFAPHYVNDHLDLARAVEVTTAASIAADRDR